MFISEKVFTRLSEQETRAAKAEATAAALAAQLGEARTQIAGLAAERGWFMHRLTQVEQERGMLMQDRLGVKISVPAFVPVMDNPEQALNGVVDISTVGGDAVADTDTDADPTQNSGIDYTNLPGYKGKR